MKKLARMFCTALSSVACVATAAAAAPHTNNALPVPKNVPKLMKTFAGADVKTRADWEKVRAPELLACFEREEYGKKGLVGDTWPDPEKPQQVGSVSYHLRTGKHFLTPYDWDRYMDFADKHGWRRAQR